jgi:(S)-3,5-dihydroxyphenylglycine transaminase
VRLEALHGSLGDPALAALGFLNEVMVRFPDAISFAPGAPHGSLVDGVDIAAQLEIFTDHLRRERGLSAEQAGRLLREYGPAQGIINDLVAAALRADYGLRVEPNDIVITVGCQEAMLLSVRALCARASDVLGVVTPAFVGVLGAARLLGVPAVGVRDGGAGADLPALRRLCRRLRDEDRRLRALYVAPDFANPSGTLMGRRTREELLALAVEEDFLLLEDVAYGFTAAEGAALPSLKALDGGGGRVIMLGTFAKLCLPGARVGFAVADQRVAGDGPDGAPLARHLAALKTMVTVNTSPIGQAVVGGMLLAHGGSLAALGRDRAKLYRRNLGLLVAELDRQLAGRPGVRHNRPDGGFFVRLRVPMRVDDALLERSATEFGVLWTPMASFHLDTSGDHEIRLSCSYLDPAEIVEGVRRLAALLRTGIDGINPTRRSVL